MADEDGDDGREDDNGDEGDDRQENSSKSSDTNRSPAASEPRLESGSNDGSPWKLGVSYGDLSEPDHSDPSASPWRLLEPNRDSSPSSPNSSLGKDLGDAFGYIAKPFDILTKKVLDPLAKLPGFEGAGDAELASKILGRVVDVFTAAELGLKLYGNFQDASARMKDAGFIDRAGLAGLKTIVDKFDDNFRDAQ